jgi:hypothetical protein
MGLMIDWVLTARLAGVIAAALGLVFCLGAGATWVSLLALRRAVAAEAERTQSNFRVLGADMAQLASANLALREYLVSLSERVDRSQHLAVGQTGPATGRAYELAARLAAGGAPSGELVMNCGLSRAEAELAVLVHGARPRPAH